METLNYYAKRVGVAFSDRVFAGKWTTFFLYLVFGLMLLAFIAATVHNRAIKPQTLQDQTDELTFVNWDKFGYWKCGGLYIFKVENDKAYSYKSVFYGRASVYYGIHKALSKIGMTNRAVVLSFVPLLEVILTGVLLALLTMRAGLWWKLDARASFVIGLAVLAVLPCLPINLYAYYRVVGGVNHAMLITAFLLCSESLLLRSKVYWPSIIFRGVVVFYMFWTDHLLASLFFVSYFIGWVLIWQQNSHIESLKQKFKILFASYILPIFIFLVVVSIQILLIKTNFSKVIFGGSSFLYRSGLDGSEKYYQTFVLFASHFSQFHAETFYTSLVALLLLLAFSWKIDCRWLTFLAVMLSSTFFIYAYIFSQATMIHPHLFRNLFMLPQMFLCFGALPLLLSKLTKQTPVFSYVTILFAICYAFYFLRMFARMYKPDAALFGSF